MQPLTDFADQAVILPLALTVACALVALRWPRGAAAWTVAVAFALGATLAAKLACAACAWRLAATWPRSPSGHVAAAIVVYGGLAAVAMPGWWRIAAAALIGGGIGVSRLALGVHSPADVAAGAALGAAGLLVFRRLAGPAPGRLRRSWLLAVAAVCVALTHGHHLRAEDAIGGAARSGVWPLSLCRPAGLDQARP